MSMYTVLVEAHSGWRHLVVLILTIAILRALWGWLRKSDWSVWDQRLGMAAPIVLDVQLVLGIVVWIVGQQWQGYNPLAAWEHPVTMILAVVAAHLAWTRVKKQTNAPAKFRTEAIGYAIAGAIVTLGVLRITHVI